MGEHLTEGGRFLSDKYRVVRISDGEDVSANKLVLSFNDLDAVPCIEDYARTIGGDEPWEHPLAGDILRALGIEDPGGM